MTFFYINVIYYKGEPYNIFNLCHINITGSKISTKTQLIFNFVAAVYTTFTTAEYMTLTTAEFMTITTAEYMIFMTADFMTFTTNLLPSKH